MINIIGLCGICGIVVTLYAIYVERMAKSKSGGGQSKYKAICDVNDSMSCTLVLTSKYSKMMGTIFNLDKDSWFNLPNTYYGLLFYVCVTLYPLYPFILIPFREVLLLGASLMSIVSSVMLAYILYFKLKNLCMVCIVTYVINITILLSAINEFQ